MRRARRTLLSAAGLCGLALLFAQCFDPALPDCAYRCSTEGEPLCPAGYECREDRYCHKAGSTAACPYTMDLSAPPDQRPAPDLSEPVDGGDGDGGTDLAGGD